MSKGCKKGTKNSCKAYKAAGRREINKKRTAVREAKKLIKALEKRVRREAGVK